MKNLTDLKELEPCEKGYKFAKSKNSLINAWNTCERGDWMLWFTGQLNCPLPLFTLAKGKCAETVLHLMCDERSRTAVKIAIDFGNGIATREELCDAAAAAKAAYDAAFDDATAVVKAAHAAAFDDGTDAAERSAAFTAYAAAFAAFAAAADDVIFAAAERSADAAAHAAHAACAKAYADACAASASYSDAYEDAEKANQLKTANICRLILTDFIKSVLTK